MASTPGGATMPPGNLDATASGLSIPLAGQVAELLFVNGQTTVGVDRAVARLSRRFAQPMLVAAHWGDLTVQPGPTGFGVRMAADPVAVDIGRVLATEAVVDELCHGRVAPEAASARLDAVARRPPVSLARFTPMAAAGAAALSVIFGAADILTVVLVALSAGLGAALRRGVAGISHNPLAQPFCAALLAGVIGGCATSLHWPVAHRLVALCPCMVLIPGPHFLNGSIDLARARVVLGAARVTFASLIVVAISTGLLAGLSLAASGLPAGGPPRLVPLPLDVVAAGVAVAAYGSFFNMPWRLLPVPVGIGMAAHALRWALLAHGFSVDVGALAACLLVGTTIAPLSHRLRLPFGASAFAAVVSLMPGIFMFEAASGALALIDQGEAISTATMFGLWRNMTTALAIMLAMTAGLIVPKMILDLRLRAGSSGEP